MMILSDYLNGVIDNRGRNPDRYFEKEKYPVIDNFLIKNELHPNILQATRYINEQTYQNFLRGYVYPNMVIMTLVGNGIGNVTTISDVNSVIIQNTIGFDVKKDLLSDLFLFYFFRYKLDAIKQFDRGSGQPSIKKTDLLCMEVNFPALKIQEKIASILSALDHKIELNQRQNNNLEQQAQALFKSWFVDFEPFGGVMPEDWQCLTLGEVTENIRARIGKNNYTVLSAVNTGKLQPSDEYFSKQVYSKNTEKYIIVEEGNFAYNPARINIGSIGINELGYTGCVSPVYVAVKVDKNYESFFRFYFKSSIFNEETKTRASGSVRQSLNYSDFALIEINYPSQDIAKKFNELYKNFFKVEKEIENENQRLIELRDALLPKLMSGEIDVSNVDISALTSTDKLSFRCRSPPKKYLIDFPKYLFLIRQIVVFSFGNL